MEESAQERENVMGKSSTRTEDALDLKRITAEVAARHGMLVRQDDPAIEPGRIADQMPFANDRGLIAGLLQELGERNLRAIELAVCIVVEAVCMVVLAGEDTLAQR